MLEWDLIESHESAVESLKTFTKNEVATLKYKQTFLGACYLKLQEESAWCMCNVDKLNQFVEMCEKIIPFVDELEELLRTCNLNPTGTTCILSFLTLFSFVCL